MTTSATTTAATGSASPMTESEAESHIVGTCFKTGPPGALGVELEWLVHDGHDQHAPVPPARLDGVVSSARSLALRGAITTEPGGQLELSSAPAPSLGACLDQVGGDLERLRALASAFGLRLSGVGLDPVREPNRLTTEPRYAAMERHFDRGGPDGRVMMCSTAAVQVCLEAGEEYGAAGGAGSAEIRWLALHGLGPVLVAAFANSPLHRGRPTGWRSTRLAVWWRIDPSRTRPPASGTDPRESWARYALDANVLAVRGDGRWDTPDGLTFRDWLRGYGPRPATCADLDYHLTTLFPPIRPRGFLEVRFVDAQPAGGWAVVAAVTSALVDDPLALDIVLDATAPVRGRWLAAARHGLADPVLASVAETCFQAALPALGRLGVAESVRRQVADYADRYVSARRCPADDVLDAWSYGHVLIGEDIAPC
ncbi:MAG TPA: ergothioneine biosynthesis glutamate--cysteine ligase EgtA [Mycobacteriales bacterium]|nr:ergothioneine biosynthesis glutamate--cysteine ligase EgtA [Mycobacteriales bacterium]